MGDSTPLCALGAAFRMTKIKRPNEEKYDEEKIRCMLLCDREPICEARGQMML